MLASLVPTIRQRHERKRDREQIYNANARERAAVRGAERERPRASESFGSPGRAGAGSVGGQGNTTIALVEVEIATEW